MTTKGEARLLQPEREKPYKPETAAEIEARADTLMKTSAVMQSEAMRLYVKAAQRREDG